MTTAPGSTKLWPIVWSKADLTYQLPRTPSATTRAGHSNIAERVELLTDQKERVSDLLPVLRGRRPASLERRNVFAERLPARSRRSHFSTCWAAPSEVVIESGNDLLHPVKPRAVTRQSNSIGADPSVSPKRESSPLPSDGASRFRNSGK